MAQMAVRGGALADTPCSSFLSPSPPVSPEGHDRASCGNVARLRAVLTE